MSSLATARLTLLLCAAALLAACDRGSGPSAGVAEPGVIRIATEPGDAQIALDGRPQGRTPAGAGEALALRMPDGRYLVRAQKDADESSEYFGELEIDHAAARPQPVVTLRLERRLTAAGESARAAAQARTDAREQAWMARFELHADGTATDATSGLTWTRCSVGQRWDGEACIGEASRIGWERAIEAGAGLSFAGHDDWRLPTRDELLTLVYCSTGRRFARDSEGSGGACEGAYERPVILGGVFPNTPVGNFWSATPHDGYSHAAWGVAFANGAAGIGIRSEHVYVRLVRDGRSAAR